MSNAGTSRPWRSRLDQASAGGLNTGRLDPSAFAPLLTAFARSLAQELAPLLREAQVPQTPQAVAPEEPAYLTVGETCKRFEISRATFDRMMRDERCTLRDVVIRVPPLTGRVKVPLREFEAWLREYQQRKRRGRPLGS